MPRSAQSGMTERGKQVREALLSIDGVLESDSIFSDDMAYWVNGKEIAHFHGQDSLELRLTRPVIRELRDQLKAEPHVKLRNASSDWLIMSFASAADVRFIASLAKRAAEAHRPSTSVPPKPPPTGVQLARMRRFH